MRRHFLSALGAVALWATAATAQGTNEFNVGAHGGYTLFDKGAGLEDAPFIGVDAAYRFAGAKLGGFDFSLGFTFDASRPKTRGDQFPAVAFDFGDTTFLYSVAQRTTLLQYAAMGQLGQSFGRARLYAMGGGGAYTFFLDGRQNLAAESFTKPMALVGGGLEYAVGQNFGFRFEARDFIMLDYERDLLDASVGYAQDRRIFDALPPADPTKSTLNNIQASIVFTYVPNRRGVTSEVGR